MRTRPAGAVQVGQHLSFRTTCGREVRVSVLTLSGIQPPAQRVSLDISPVSPAAEETWAGFTVDEARQLAAALLAQAAAQAQRGTCGVPISRPGPAAQEASQASTCRPPEPCGMVTGSPRSLRHDLHRHTRATVPCRDTSVRVRHRLITAPFAARRRQQTPQAAIGSVATGGP